MKTLIHVGSSNLICRTYHLQVAWFQLYEKWEISEHNIILHSEKELSFYFCVVYSNFRVLFFFFSSILIFYFSNFYEVFPLWHTTCQWLKSCPSEQSSLYMHLHLPTPCFAQTWKTLKSGRGFHLKYEEIQLGFCFTMNFFPPKWTLSDKRWYKNSQTRMGIHSWILHSLGQSTS